MSDLAALSIAEIGQRLRDGRLTSFELTHDCLRRLEKLDPTYHAFVTVTAERAIDDARRADRELAEGFDRGPMHGVPYALKDLIDTAGIRTTCGSGVFADRVPVADAVVARRLVEAGGVLVGKVMTYEFALVGPSRDLPFPPAANPWNINHITGGSSSGSAAAVAGGLVRTAIGTDTGGSVRSPSSYCGIVGLKPSFGRVGRTGVFPLSQSLDHVGPLSACVADAAFTLDALSGYDPNDSGSLNQQWRPAAGRLEEGIAGRRIAYARGWFANDPDISSAILVAMDEAASQLSMLGARIEEITFPDYTMFEDAGAVILHYEALRHHLAMMQSHADQYGRRGYQTLASGVCLSEDDYAVARRGGAALSAELHALLEPFDAAITVNTLTAALPLSAFDGDNAVWTPMRTLPFNVTGSPVVAVPVGFDDGLPIGMQIIGKHGDDDLICAIGHAFEQNTIHSAQRPPALPVGQEAGEISRGYE